MDSATCQAVRFEDQLIATVRAVILVSATSPFLRSRQAGPLSAQEFPFACLNLAVGGVSSTRMAGVHENYTDLSKPNVPS